MNYDAHVKRSRSGFTLIELLVVVAIVAVLASILFSVVSGAKENARRTACQSNLKQIAIAMQQYVQNNDGVYPPENNWQSRIFSYVKSVQVFHCPSSHDTRSGMEASDYDYFFARLNTILPPEAGQNMARLAGTQESALATPATIYLNSDYTWASSGRSAVSGELPDGRAVLRTPCGRSWAGSTRHSGGGNWSYVDGHVKWLTPEEAGEVECLNGPLPAPFKN